MCRNIRPLFNFDPPATDEEVRAASVQFVRKISGFTAPSKANQDAFNRAIDEIAAVARTAGRRTGNQRAEEESRRGSAESKSACGRTLRHDTRLRVDGQIP